MLNIFKLSDILQSEGQPRVVLESVNFIIKGMANGKGLPGKNEQYWLLWLTIIFYSAKMSAFFYAPYYSLTLFILSFFPFFLFFSG